MEFIRLQSKKYNLNTKSRSYVWGRKSFNEVLLEDLRLADEFGKMDYQQKGIYKSIDKSDNDALVELWDSVFENENNGYYVLNGVSCYESTDKQLLINYFHEHDKIGDKWNDDNSYILYFEGYRTGEGHNDEVVARFEHEIKRMTIKEFMNK